MQRNWGRRLGCWDRTAPAAHGLGGGMLCTNLRPESGQLFKGGLKVKLPNWESCKFEMSSYLLFWRISSGRLASFLQSSQHREGEGDAAPPRTPRPQHQQVAGGCRHRLFPCHPGPRLPSVRQPDRAPSHTPTRTLNLSVAKVPEMPVKGEGGKVRSTVIHATVAAVGPGDRSSHARVRNWLLDSKTRSVLEDMVVLQLLRCFPWRTTVTVACTVK
ncbi:uncharacterized protein WM277_027173 isoform 1-T1 [Molossus nigricans]